MIEIKDKYRELGSFQLKSGRMLVTDPCYSTSDDVLEVLPGKWKAAIQISHEGDWGIRVKELYAYHPKASNLAEAEFRTLEGAPFEVGVDSGQAGFFDLNKYPNGSSDADFYDEICNLETDGVHGGVVKFGAMSSTGFGDGGYRCSTYSKDGKIVAVKITFIEDDDHERDWQDEEDSDEK